MFSMYAVKVKRVSKADETVLTASRARKAAEDNAEQRVAPGRLREDPERVAGRSGRCRA
jgi:hypothetical protein